MSLALLFPYLMLNMFRMLVHPSSGACDLFVELFHGLYCSGLMCVGVTLWFGWGGVVSLCRLKPVASAMHCLTLRHFKARISAIFSVDICSNLTVCVYSGALWCAIVLTWRCLCCRTEQTWQTPQRRQSTPA